MAGPMQARRCVAAAALLAVVLFLQGGNDWHPAWPEPGGDAQPTFTWSLTGCIALRNMTLRNFTQ